MSTVSVLAQADSVESKTNLKQSPAYNRKQQQSFPNFMYQSCRALQLAELRTLYKLDFVAGKGRDIDQAIHLLGLFHQQYPMTMGSTRTVD